MDDAQLVAALDRRNPAALAALFDRHVGVVYRLAHGLLGEQASAEAVVYETFLAAWREPRPPAAADDARLWLLTSAAARARRWPGAAPRPDAARVAVILATRCGLTCREIAPVTGTTAERARLLLRLGLARLREERPRP